MIAGALAGPFRFRMQCLYHDGYSAGILHSRKSRMWIQGGSLEPGTRGNSSGDVQPIWEEIQPTLKISD